MAEQYANDAQTSLASGISASDTSLTVLSAAGFPSQGTFRIRIDNEILAVTAVSGATWTVSRAAEAASGVQQAAAHAAGSLVTHVLTAAALQAVPANLPTVAAPGTYGDASHYLILTIDAQGRVTGVSLQAVSGAPFLDSAVLVQNSTDPTKQLIFSAAALATGTTRTVTFPNANITVAALNLANTFTVGPQTMPLGVFGPALVANDPVVTLKGEAGGTFPIVFDAAGNLGFGKGGSGVANLIYNVNGLVTANTAGTINFFIATSTSTAFETKTDDTSTVGDVMTFRHNSNGTAATGFGSRATFYLESSTTENRAAADLTVSWADATDATRKGRLTVSAWDTAAREGFRVEANGSAALISFFGVGAVAKQTSGADLTNNVTAGGTNDTIANFTDLATYANDAAAIRNDIYQLARKLKQVNDAMRLYGLLT